MPSYKSVKSLYDISVKTIYKNIYGICVKLNNENVKEKTEILENLNDHLRSFIHGR